MFFKSYIDLIFISRKKWEFEIKNNIKIKNLTFLNINLILIYSAKFIYS